MPDGRRRWLRFLPGSSSTNRPRPSLLLLTRYEADGASSRIRLLQFESVFAERFEVTTQALLSNRYIGALQRGARAEMRVRSALGGLRRASYALWLVVSRKKFDVVILEQEYITYLPTRVEILILRAIRKGPLIIDIDDANHLRYVGRRGLVGLVCGEKNRHIWSGAAAVVCGSQALLDDVLRMGGASAQARLVPSVPQRFDGCRRIRKSVPFTIGWIGSPSTAVDLNIVVEPLTRLGQEMGIRLLVVGANIDPIPGVSTLAVPWTRETEQQALETMDVGIAPLSSDDFRARKCGFKIVNYMNAGIPVVASPVGGNASLLSRDGYVGGLLADEADEWYLGLRRFAEDAEFRATMSEGATLLSERYFSWTIASCAWREVLDSCDVVR